MSRLGGCAGALGRIVAVLLAAGLALLLPLAVMGFNAGRVLFSPEEVAGVITERGLDSGALRRLVSERLLSPEAAGGAPEFSLARAMSYLEPDEVDRVLDLLIPPEWARSQVSGILTGLYEWMDNEQLSPSLQLDVRPIQQGLLSGGAARLVETILDSWPACTVEQLDELGLAASVGGEVPIQYCEPPEPHRTQISELATEGLIEAARAMPPQIDLGGPDPAQPSANPATVMAVKEQMRLWRALTSWGWLLPLSFLGLIMALVVRSLRGLARWWGIPLLIGGLLSLLAALIGSGLAEGMISQVFAEAALPEALTRLLQSILDGLRDRILGRVFVHSLLLILGAGFLLFLGFLLGRRQRVAAPGPMPPAPPQPARAPGAPPAATPAATVPTRAEPKPLPDSEKPTGMFG